VSGTKQVCDCYTGVTLCTWMPCEYVPVSPLPEKTFDSHPKIPGY